MIDNSSYHTLYSILCLKSSLIFLTEVRRCGSFGLRIILRNLRKTKRQKIREKDHKGFSFVCKIWLIAQKKRKVKKEMNFVLKF